MINTNNDGPRVRKIYKLPFGFAFGVDSMTYGCLPPFSLKRYVFAMGGETDDFYWWQIRVLWFYFGRQTFKGKPNA